MPSAAEKVERATPSAASNRKGPMPALSEAAGNGKPVKVKTRDDRIIEVPVKVARLFKTTGGVIDEGRAAASDIVPLPNVHSSALAKAIEYYEKHLGTNAGNSSELDLCSWDDRLVGDLDLDLDGLYDLMMAAHHLELERIRDLTCKSVARRMAGKSPEQIGATLSIETAEEDEAAIRDETPFAFDD